MPLKGRRCPADTRSMDLLTTTRAAGYRLPSPELDAPVVEGVDLDALAELLARPDELTDALNQVHDLLAAAYRREGAGVQRIVFAGAGCVYKVPTIDTGVWGLPAEHVLANVMEALTYEHDLLAGEWQVAPCRLVSVHSIPIVVMVWVECHDRIEDEDAYRYVDSGQVAWCDEANSNVVFDAGMCPPDQEAEDWTARFEAYTGALLPAFHRLYQRDVAA